MRSTNTSVSPYELVHGVSDHLMAYGRYYGPMSTTPEETQDQVPLPSPDNSHDGSEKSSRSEKSSNSAKSSSNEMPKRRSMLRVVGTYVSWTLSTLAVLYTCIRLFGLDYGWLLIVVITLVPTALVVFAVLALTQAIFRQYIAAILSGICVLALAFVVVPRFVGNGGQAVMHSPQLTILSANLYVGSADLEQLVEMVKDHKVDILALQELTSYAYDRLRELGLEEELPYHIAETGWAAEGSGLYSRNPMEQQEDEELDSLFFQPVGQITVEHLWDGDPYIFNFMAVHTSAPASPARVPSWTDDLQNYPYSSEKQEWILTGDFNSTWDHHLFRNVVDRGYKDAAMDLGKALKPTWQMPGYLNGILKLPGSALDHVLVHEEMAVDSYEILDDIGSDHKPVLVKIQL